MGALERIIIAWYFVFFSYAGVGTVVGPFDSRKDCEDMQKYVQDLRNRYVSSATHCWWSNK